MIPKIGSINAKKLIAYCGGIQEVFHHKKKDLLKIPGVGDALANAITGSDVLGKAEREVEFALKHNIKILYYLDADYPEWLKQCEDGPIVLFAKGANGLNFNEHKMLSVVGTRNATDYGKSFCDEVISTLAQNGQKVAIVSGLAYGIDIAAHKAALKNGLPTVAVLGHGLDTIYPAIHRNAAAEIAQTGALVTDFPTGTEFDRKHFIKRNRIIAGMSAATLVVESDAQGGSLITADLAISYNRDVFALPGDITSRYSKGTNYLIKTNRAALVESAEDIEFLLGWEKKESKAVQQTLFPTSLTPEEQQVLTFLRANGKEAIDVIAVKTNLPIPKVSAILLNLEFAGFVKPLPGKVFALIGTR
ncbi:MAG: DNA-processing protein DprA [Bacteroidales bacterium]|nr:DNA-processing protein DprA [Bacteroidales bacterium]MBN2749789.1 DNA-processing protein DprA [Bacteroidales bacterium]